MPKQVQVRVATSGKLKWMTEPAAQRLITSNPKEYIPVQPPTVDAITLPPLAQKKSVEVAAEDKAPEPIAPNAEEPKSIGYNVPSNEVKAQHVTTTQTTKQFLKQK